MISRKKKLLSRDNRLRLMLTLGLAVLLPALALIFVNYHHVKSIERDKKIEALIHRDFQQMLAISEKKINQKAYAMADEARYHFPTPGIESDEEWDKILASLLSKNPWLSHVFLFDKEKGLRFHSQPQQMEEDKYFLKEHEMLKGAYGGWLSMEAHSLVEGMRKKSRPFNFYTNHVKRNTGEEYQTTAFFLLPRVSGDRVAMGGLCFEPGYLRKTFFPEVLEELVTEKLRDEGGNRLAMVVYSADYDGKYDHKPVAMTAEWGDGKPEVIHNLDDIFHGLSLGIKFQGTSANEIGRRWVLQSFLILGGLSLVMITGLVLAYRSVSKEMALARLKSDFVSNVSHELRTPLSLIRLYAETLELGRITVQEKKEEYYRIIRKESERLTALINNILDFSRIEAGRKEYDFRETDIGELVRNTLDAYRYQIEQQGFAFEQNIDPSLPTVRVDREAIARALVNLINNALKYSASEKFLAVKLYRAGQALKLEVVDHGIGITRREQAKIFEKFYRTGDPLVHNTKGSGLGLSLVRHITQAHGGDVEVESTPGKGSKFTLSFPLAAPAQ